MKPNFTLTYRSFIPCSAIVVTVALMSGCANSPRHLVTNLWRRGDATPMKHDGREPTFASFRHRFVSKESDGTRDSDNMSSKRAGRVLIKHSVMTPPPSPKPVRMSMNDKKRERLIVADDPFTQRALEDMRSPADESAKAQVNTLPKRRVNEGLRASVPLRQQSPKRRVTEELANHGVRQTNSLKLLPDDVPATIPRTDSIGDAPQAIAKADVNSEAKSKPESTFDERADNIDKLMRESRAEMQLARLSELIEKQENVVADESNESALKVDQPIASTSTSASADTSSDESNGSGILIVASESVPPRIPKNPAETILNPVSLQPELELPDQIAIVAAHGQQQGGESERITNENLVADHSNEANLLTVPSLKLLGANASLQPARAQGTTGTAEPFPSLDGPMLSPSLLPLQDSDGTLMTSADSNDSAQAKSGKRLISPNWNQEPQVIVESENRSPWIVWGVALVIILAVVGYIAKRRGSKIMTGTNG